MRQITEQIPLYVCRSFCVQSQQGGKKKREGWCVYVNITVNLHLKE